MSTAASLIDKTGFYLLVACSVFAPIPFGSSTPTAAGFLGVVLALCILGAPFIPAPDSRVRQLIDVLIALSWLLIVWTLFQTLPWHNSTPSTALTEAGDTMVGLPHARLHLQPLHSIGYVLIPFAAFTSALVYVRDDARYIIFLHIFLGSGFVVTAFGITEYALSSQTILLQPKTYYLGSFTGTFINPNTAASYFGAMLLLSLALCLRQMGNVRRHQHMVSAAVRDQHLRNFLIYCVWTVVFATALLLTRSRAGILSSFVAIVGFTWAYAYVSMRDRGLPEWSVALSTFGAAAVAILLFGLLGQRVMLRVESEGLLDTARLCTYRSTWQAIQDHFWLGTGLGTFQDVFPAYRSPECGLNGYWEMAHSVFLEAWLSLGAAFLIVLVIVYYQLIKTYVYGYHHRHRFRFVPLVSLAILALLTLHSLVDFSLQVPGMAVVSAIALGTGARMSVTPKLTPKTQ